MAEALTQHQILVEQVDSDVHVQIPEYLGGGSITESDYTVSENQAKLIMSVLGWATEDKESYDATIEATTPELPIRDILELQWENKDALRIIKPLFTLIQAKKELGREVSIDEEMAFYRFQMRSAQVDGAIYMYHNDPDAMDRLAYSRETKDRIEAKKAELARRIEGGMFYDDGSANSPAVERRKRDRRTVVLSGDIFTSEYRTSKLGGITLYLLDGKLIPEEDVDEIAAVACMDAKSAGKEVMTPEEFEDLESRANVVMSSDSMWAAREARRMQSNIARARLITGDGTSMISRPKPGV
jgi:hypothetical protein